MRIHELRREIRAINISESACLILPVHAVEGALCLTKWSESHWSVSLVERGEKVVENDFRDENSACRFFLKYAISDPTYFKDFSMANLANLKVRSLNLLEKYGYLDVSHI